MPSKLNISHVKDLFVFCRIGGVFPVNRIGGNEGRNICFSKTWFFYSLALVVTQASFSLYSLKKELKNYHVFHSTEVHNTTTLVVMCCDITFLAASCILIVIFSAR